MRNFKYHVLTILICGMNQCKFFKMMFLRGLQIICRLHKLMFGIIIVILPFVKAHSSILKDTIPIPVTTTGDYLLLSAKGVNYLKQDSIERGISFFLSGINLKNQVDHKDRLYDYVDYEITQLLTILNSKILNAEEQKIGNQFVQEFIMKGKISGNDDINQLVVRYLKKYPKSIFVNRLEIYNYCLGKNPHEFNKLLPQLIKLLDIDSSIVSINLLKGEIEYFEGQYKEAVKNFARVTRYVPSYAFVYNYRALCYNYLNLFDAAIKDLNTAIELYPEYELAYNNRGNTYSKKHMKNEAIADYKKAIAINANFKWPYYNLSLVYKDANMPDSALMFNRDALDLSPEDSQLYKDRGDIFYDMENFNDAINNYTKCINLKPSMAINYVKRGNAYFFNNNIEQAIKDFENAISIDNNYTYAIQRLGDCYKLEKEYLKAITFYDKAIKLNSKFKYAFVSKAMCYIRLENYAEAKKILLKALKIDSTYPSALGNLGWTYYCLGNFEQCIYYSKKAVKFDPNAYYAMFNIALATMRLGKFEESKELYVMFINNIKEHKVEIAKGAIEDLQSLVKQNILKDQANYILKNIFEYSQ
jgi:tetratricopeptide (TPR) repeat protein